MTHHIYSMCISELFHWLSFFVSEKEIEDIGKIFYNTNAIILYIMCNYVINCYA